MFSFTELLTSLAKGRKSVRKPKVINRYFIRDVATVSGLSGTEKVWVSSVPLWS